MSPRQAEWQVRREPVEQSGGKAVKIADGWVIPRWAVTRLVDPSGTYPTVEARAEVRGKGEALRVLVTSVTLSHDGRGVKAADLRALASRMQDLALEVFAPHTIKDDGNRDEASVSALIKAVDHARRGPSITMVEREDDCLHRWETEFQPAGMTQADAAQEMGLRPSSFRSYLTHARARRGY